MFICFMDGKNDNNSIKRNNYTGELYGLTCTMSCIKAVITVQKHNQSSI